MCCGGRLLADFVAGTTELPQGLPETVAECLTVTADGAWVVWAHKVAWAEREGFRALTGGTYPADARARCLQGARHEAPQPHCTCGFHAVSTSGSVPFRGRQGMAALDVVLSGRVLAFEWIPRGMLFRAQRQTVVKVDVPQGPPQPRPRDPGGRTALVRPGTPEDIGPVRLALPVATPPCIAISDDAGFCAGSVPAHPEPERVAALV
jgi:hypothetical protein